MDGSRRPGDGPSLEPHAAEHAAKTRSKQPGSGGEAVRRALRCFLLFVGTPLTLTSTPALAAIPSSERDVLLALYANTNGANWTNRAGWNGPAGTECSWHGVGCMGERVWSIVLVGNQLDGTLPATLNQLTNMTILSVGGNQLRGSIPTLAGLTKLVNFSVGNNQLTGSLPSLTGLSSLVVFDADTNQLTGAIPPIADLSSLQTFDVSRNQLSGPIPPLGGLSKLATFSAFFNQLTGVIPSLSGLTSLSTFNVFGNRLGGSIPTLSGLTVLQSFLVHDNQLTGSLPALAGLTSLSMFVVHNNQITGNVPAVPSPNNLMRNGSVLCPNFLNPTSDPAWDAATGRTPWYSECLTAPVAAFTWSPSAPVQNQAVQFTDTSTGSPTSWSWAFGDGYSSTSRHPTHTYASCGAYQITLSVANSAGNSTVSQAIAVTGCGSAPLISGFTASPTSATVGQAVSFSCSATGSPSPTYLMSFGDGYSSPSSSTAHSYSAHGGYTATCTATNTNGATSASIGVTITATPVCSTFAISPTTSNPPGAAGSIAVGVSGAPSGCQGGSWTANGNGDWISVVPSGGTGSATVMVSWTANATSSARSGAALIANQTFSIVQNAQGSGPLSPEVHILPSSAFRAGANGAEYRTDVRIINQGSSAVTVTGFFYDQVTSTTSQSNPFRIEGRNQAAFDNVLQSLFGRTLSQGSYGPIRFEASGPILVGASVNNVNACGSGAVSGQWLPGIRSATAPKAGVIGQLAVSSSGSSGYRTNLVFVNPGGAPATVTVKIRRGGGDLLSAATIGPLSANGFRQVALDAATFPGVTGMTDTNLWLEFTSDQPVIAYATIIHNVSGDPFAVVASADVSAFEPREVTFALPGGVPLVMTLIPAGSFQMGSPTTERGRNENETPHAVTLSSDYFMGKYEVTRAQWQAVMGNDSLPYSACGGNCPVESVSWQDVRGPNGFIARLGQLLGIAKFRLPTEAEWERAARGGTQTRFAFGDALNGDDSCGTNAEAEPFVLWCGDWGALHPVGGKPPNAYGLFDMHGGVSEWVEDWYGEYPSTAQVNPGGPSTGSFRVVRSSCFTTLLKDFRSARRNTAPPDWIGTGTCVGFRLAMSP